jgi:hypothetical protein
MFSMNESILTLHPEGKQGVCIARRKYQLVRSAIIEAINCNGPLTFRELMDTVTHSLVGRFYGSIPWYVTIVKRDLEARHEIECVPHTRPQRFRVATSLEHVQS